MVTREKIFKDFQDANPDLKFKFRIDGRLEYICPHGIGHTVYAPPILQDDGTYYRDYVHGCDGCCKNVIIPRKYQYLN